MMARYMIEDYTQTTTSDRFDVEPRLDESEEVANRIEASVATLKNLLERGRTIYGMFSVHKIMSLRILVLGCIQK